MSVHVIFIISDCISKFRSLNETPMRLIICGLYICFIFIFFYLDQHCSMEDDRRYRLQYAICGPRIHAPRTQITIF